MSLRNDLMRAAQLKDVKQMNQIYSNAIYADPNKCDVDRICLEVVKSGEFHLSPTVAEAIINPKGVIAGGGIVFEQRNGI